MIRAMARMGMMMRMAVIFASVIVGMHVLGSMVFFGYMSGLPGVLMAPVLGLFSWYFGLLELIGLVIQHVIYRPNGSVGRVLGLMVFSAVAGGATMALLVPKEEKREREFAIAGGLAGASAAVFSCCCVVVVKGRASRRDEVVVAEE
jgi:hypothetical protein